MSDAEAEAWRDTVRALGERIHQNGLTLHLDLFDASNVHDWSRYGPKQIAECDFTLIIPSIAYRERWEGHNDPRQGAGAAREIDTLKGLFNRDQDKFRDQVRAVLLPGITVNEVPTEILAGIVWYRVDPETEIGLPDLLRDLTGQPLYVLPAPGPVPNLPPRPPVT
ncbi:hypothetical protein I6A60_13770 [Frankia sp. AgB1.9]|uniref:hypothetical protein n=1 Tax=unclassified Frankia TaxID=2632575 RepID=UPI0019343F28|nr:MULTISPECIES: hypothetical protein [unclassified Frankia]MBL7487596.1 hypothetical protein [Frankia sp. AgW1.1]MBL7548938.1 hypothetical protein [Frankia sp. AgB1.9]MBL7623474.1 hypothetical protein [Frankia sp. AgB1.8]